MSQVYLKMEIVVPALVVVPAVVLAVVLAVTPAVDPVLEDPVMLYLDLAT